MLERALAIDEAALSPNDPRVASSLEELARVLIRQDRLKEARRLAERSLTIHEVAHGPEHEAVAGSLSVLSKVVYQQRDFATARTLLERAHRM